MVINILIGIITHRHHEAEAHLPHPHPHHHMTELTFHEGLGGPRGHRASMAESQKRQDECSH